MVFFLEQSEKKIDVFNFFSLTDNEYLFDNSL